MRALAPPVPYLDRLTRTHRSAAGGAAALRGAGERAGARLRGYGRSSTCGPTTFDQALPVSASQLVDQVMAPRRAG